MKSGKVKAICGSTYMLMQDEELWAKQLPLGVEESCMYVSTKYKWSLQVDLITVSIYCLQIVHTYYVCVVLCV